MAENPTLDPGHRGYGSCPSCTIQIPSDAAFCPHCRQPVTAEAEASSDIRKLLVPPDRFVVLKRFYRDHGKWLKAAAPVVAGILVLWAVYAIWEGPRILVAQDNSFRIEVEREKAGGGASLLKGTLTNRGEDVPDLSLRSIGIIAEFDYRDGRSERKRIFPRSPYRGEGALLRGESGVFEIPVPRDVKAVTLRGEIVNLGEDRRLIPAAREIRRNPARRRR